MVTFIWCYAHLIGRAYSLNYTRLPSHLFCDFLSTWQSKRCWYQSWQSSESKHCWKVLFWLHCETTQQGIQLQELLWTICKAPDQTRDFKETTMFSVYVQHFLLSLSFIFVPFPPFLAQRSRPKHTSSDWPITSFPFLSTSPIMRIIIMILVKTPAYEQDVCAKNLKVNVPLQHLKILNSDCKQKL